MGGERITIYAGDPIRAVLDQAGGENRSGRLNEVCQRYDAIIRDTLSTLPLSRDEWGAIVDAHSGFTMDNLNWETVWATILDSPDISENWDIDHKALGWKLHELPLVARAAVAEVIERFYTADVEGATNEELLKRAGASWPTPKEVE